MYCKLAKCSDLEWLPQELVLYANALYEQHLTVQLPADASFLSAEIVRLGRTAAGETLQQGRWRSALSICRRSDKPHQADRWEIVDRLDLGGDALNDQHGLNKQPVFGSLVWAAPMPLSGDALTQLLELVRSDRAGLEGTLRCSSLDQGLVARYAGPSSRDARFWFSRIWARTRALRALSSPQIPRVWPLQEQPLPTSSRPAPHRATHHNPLPGGRKTPALSTRVGPIPSKDRAVRLRKRIARHPWIGHWQVLFRLRCRFRPR